MLTKGIKDQAEQEQFEQIKNFFEACDTDMERKAIFFMFTTDMSYSRNAILIAMKELGIEDNMSLRREKHDTRRS